MADASPPHSLNDTLWLAVSDDGLLRARVARTTELVREALRRHQPAPLGQKALARALSAVAVFPVDWGKIDRVSIQWSGGGPMGSVFAELREPGSLRARLTHPGAQPRSPLSGERRGAGLGLLPGGYVSVLRQAPKGSHQHGQVPLRNGEVDEDLEAYFEASEQINTRVRAISAFNDEGLSHAAGLLVQALPGAEAEDVTLADPEAIEGLDPAAAPELWLKTLFRRPFRILESYPLSFQCTCGRERAAAGISLLEQEELIEMVVKDKGADVTCEFCNENYRFSADELLTILDTKAAQTSTRDEGEA